MKAPLRLAARPCRLCGGALSALERMQGDVCHRLDCRRRATAQRREAARAADLARRQRTLARDLDAPAIAAAPVLWLQAYEARFVPLPAAARREQVAWLGALAAAPSPAAPPAAAADSAPEPAIAGRVCAFCRGRCCALVAFRHGFVDRALLQRHADDAHGGDAAAAARDYAGHIPKTHVKGGCVYQGREGCVLPRTMRADVCNGFRCAPLVEAAQHAGSAAGVVVAMGMPATAPRAAWVHDAASHPLPRRPRRLPR